MFDVASLGSGPATLRRWHPSVLMLAGRCGLLQLLNGSTYACMCEWLCVSSVAARGALASVRSSRAGWLQNMVYYWTFEWSETADDLAPWIENIPPLGCIGGWLRRSQTDVRQT